MQYPSGLVVSLKIVYIHLVSIDCSFKFQILHHQPSLAQLENLAFGQVRLLVLLSKVPEMISHLFTHR